MTWQQNYSVGLGDKTTWLGLGNKTTWLGLVNKLVY